MAPTGGVKFERHIEAMNKKVNTVILLSLVLLIWGGVAFRIWIWVKPEHSVPHSDFVEMADDKTPPATLLLNYRDPFLSKGKNTATTVAPAARKASEPRPAIKYKGIVRGKDGIQRAIVEYQGKISTLAKGESIVGVKIHEMAPESISIMWNGQLEILDVQ